MTVLLPSSDAIFLEPLKIQELDIEVPKGAGVVKRDVASALVDGVFPGILERDPEERTRMLDALCGEIKERPPDFDDDTPESTLKLLAAMDPIEKEAFGPLIQEALDKLDASEKKHLNKMKMEAKLAAMGAEPSMAMLPPELQPAQAKSGAGAPVRVNAFPRQQSPLEFTCFLPNVPTLYVHWEVRRNRVYAEFKKLEGFQRTKSKSFDRSQSLNSKVNALVHIFEYIAQAYHTKFKSEPNYDAAYRPLLSMNIKPV